MADDTPDSRRIDCHALRGDAPTSDRGRKGEHRGELTRGQPSGQTAYLPPLRLIAPDGKVTLVDRNLGGDKGATAPQAVAAPITEQSEMMRLYHRLIQTNGPISLAQYMAESNARYYSSRDPLGDGGDFITAPEISQMFGELIGLWLADLWVRMGSPKKVHYVELGPGRGTLARDALETAGRYGFAPSVHLVEASSALRAVQLETLKNVQHHEDITSLPQDAPLMIVANEFFDALPIHQLVRTKKGWRERMVGLEDGALAFLAGDKPMDSAFAADASNAKKGTILETCPAAGSLIGALAERLCNQGGTGLVIDYGAFEPRTGSTLQALRAHQKVDPLEHPGEADLTAHVDFSTLSKAAIDSGARVMGQAHQGDWLRRLGIGVRLQGLQRQAAGKAAVLQRQHDRLTGDDQMGRLFKVMGFAGGEWPDGVGFDGDDWEESA